MPIKIKENKLRNSNSYRIFRFSLYGVLAHMFILISFPILQSNQKEKIRPLIKELMPSHLVRKLYKNIEIIGFDFLDENKKRIISHKFQLYPGSKFYFVLYGKRKITMAKDPEENSLKQCKALLEYINGGYFWSQKTSYIMGNKEVEKAWEEWQIGGIYKICFAIKVPLFALPGSYKFKIMNEKSSHPVVGNLIEFEKIKIAVRRPKTIKCKKVEDYELPIEECLLNPAVRGIKQAVFYWTGDIEFFIKRDLRCFKKVEIIARGTPALGVYPLLKVYAEGKEIGSTHVNNEWDKYTFDLRLDRERHILKVRFDNDGGGPGEDRNMFVNSIKLLK